MKPPAFEGPAAEKVKKSVKLAVILVVILVIALIMNPFVIIEAGHRGVVLNWGAVQKQVMPEGLNFLIPIYQKVIKVDVRIFKTDPGSEAVTKDMQDNKSKIAVNYHVLPEEASWVYQNLGTDYKFRIIDPKIQEIVKAVTARYTALELVSKREQVREEMKNELRTAILPYKIAVDDFSVVDFKWSPEFERSIEQKQVAEQQALTAQRILEKVKYEAEQKVVTARAEAEALRVQKENVTDNLIRLRQIEVTARAIEKWDGRLPQFSGGGPLPFIDLSRMEKK